MIQDIRPHQYHNEYKVVEPRREDFVVFCENGTMLVKKEMEEITFPTFAEVLRENPNLYEKARYLFEIDDRRFFLVWNMTVPNKEDWYYLEKKECREVEPMHLAFAAITAFQLHDWYESRKFCGKCGKTMVHDERERMMRCPVCGQMEYPKIAPAVIVAITDGNRLLLSKYAGRDYKKYALIAGFAEIGETIEETVRREVMEEVGLKVKNLRFYKSQPWSFTDTLLFGFFAELDGEDHIVLDETELAMAEWFEREDIPVKPNRSSLTNEMIMVFKNGGERNL